MDTNTIERPMAGDAVVWRTRYGWVHGWLVRYIDGEKALCELDRGGLLNVPVDDLVKVAS